jgi:hypothetical protein
VLDLAIFGGHDNDVWVPTQERSTQLVDLGANWRYADSLVTG